MKNSSIVVDANLAIYCVVDTPQSDLAAQVWKRLVTAGRQLFAPGLWIYETTSAIRKYQAFGVLTDDEADEALTLLEQMQVHIIEDSLSLRRNALHWAGRLRQKAAYDGFYLATAEQLEVEFWTADQVLANNARQAGAGWVHWMGEV